MTAKELLEKSLTSERENIKSFLSELSIIGSLLLRDPLSELTRKRQNNLLITSVLAILFSLALVSVIEVSLPSVKVIPTNSAIIRYVAGGITAYFLVIYLISVVQDLKIHKYITLSGYASLVSLYDTLARELSEKKGMLDELSEELEKQVGQRKKLADETTALLRELLSKHESDLNKEEQRIREIKVQEYRANEEVFKNIDQYDNVRELLTEIERIGDNMGNKIEALDTLTKEHQRLSHLRIGIEVVAPSILGIFTIWLAFFF